MLLLDTIVLHICTKRIHRAKEHCRSALHTGYGCLPPNTPPLSQNCCEDFMDFEPALSALVYRWAMMTAKRSPFFVFGSVPEIFKLSNTCSLSKKTALLPLIPVVLTVLHKGKVISAYSVDVTGTKRPVHDPFHENVHMTFG